MKHGGSGKDDEIRRIRAEHGIRNNSTAGLQDFNRAETTRVRNRGLGTHPNNARKAKRAARQASRSSGLPESDTGLDPVGAPDDDELQFLGAYTMPTPRIPQARPDLVDPILGCSSSSRVLCPGGAIIYTDGLSLWGGDNREEKEGLCLGW